MTQGPENPAPGRNNNGTNMRALLNSLGTGVAVGVGIGLALNNLALGIAIGIAIYGGEYACRRRNQTNNS